MEEELFFFFSDDWKSHLGDEGHIVAGIVEIFGIPMSLNICKVCLDCSHVWDEVMISCRVNLHHALGLIVSVPVSDFLFVFNDSTVTLASRHVLVEQRHVFLNEVLDGL